MRRSPGSFPATTRACLLARLRVVFWLAVFLGLAAMSVAGTRRQPNIIVVLVDDMGFSDLGCYGGEIPTPNIDSLAAGGLRFTQFYNAGRCCPTRASLLTGLYAHQAGVGGLTQDEGLPGYRGFLNDRCVTLAEVLRAAGYFTAHTGKWHVGHGAAERLPVQRGFERFYGAPEGGGFYFRPSAGRTVMFGNEVLYAEERPPPDGWYSTDAWTEYGLRFIDEARAAGKPFFLYLAHNAPHFPLQAAPEDIARFRGQYQAGWDRLRARRQDKQREFGVVVAGWPISPRDAAITAWEQLDAAQRDELDLRMALYAAVMARLDRSVGTLVAGLRERGVLEETLLLFLSDNGASPEGGLYGRTAGTGVPGDAASQVYAGRGWANASNTPFRMHKAYVHEGGTATPLIVHWPSRIKTGGALLGQVGHVIDLMPTLVEVAGAKYPSTFRGQTIPPMEGVSLLPAFTSPSALSTRLLFWEHQGNAAVRDGDWKLVRAGSTGSWELYEIAADRTELRDLAFVQRERAKALATAWDEWARRVGAKPYAGHEGRPD